MTNYQDIGFRVKLLKQFYYTPQSERKYELRDQDRGNVPLSAIKMPAQFDTTEIYQGTFEHLRSHPMGEMYRVKYKDFTLLAFIRQYDNTVDVNNMGKKYLYNPAIHYLLSITSKISSLAAPLPVICYDETDFHKQPEVFTATDKTIPYNVFLLENFTEMKFLDDITNDFVDGQGDIEKLNKRWKVIIFQVMYELYVCRKLLRDFRHNQLGFSSVLCYLGHFPDDEMTIGKHIYRLNYTKLQCRLTNFDEVTTSSYLDNESATKKGDNLYYDIHYFFSTIYLFYQNHQLTIPDDLMALINDVIPAKYLPAVGQTFQGLDEDEYNKNTPEMITIHAVIQNSYFDEYRIGTIDTSSSSSGSANRFKVTVVQELSDTDETSSVDTIATEELAGGSGDIALTNGNETSSTTNNSYNDSVTESETSITDYANYLLNHGSNYNKAMSSTSELTLHDGFTETETSVEVPVKKNVKMRLDAIQEETEECSTCDGESSIDPKLVKQLARMLEKKRQKKHKQKQKQKHKKHKRRDSSSSSSSSDSSSSSSSSSSSGRNEFKKPHRKTNIIPELANLINNIKGTKPTTTTMSNTSAPTSQLLQNSELAMNASKSDEKYLEPLLKEYVTAASKNNTQIPIEDIRLLEILSTNNAQKVKDLTKQFNGAGGFVLKGGCGCKKMAQDAAARPIPLMMARSHDEKKNLT